MDNTTEAAEVFQAKAEVQQIIEATSTTVRGQKVEVRVEMGQERKKWLTTYSNHVRAIEEATGMSSAKGKGELYLELRDFSVYHKEWPGDVIGKLSKDREQFEFNEEMLKYLKVSEGDIRQHMKVIK